MTQPELHSLLHCNQCCPVYSYGVGRAVHVELNTEAAYLSSISLFSSSLSLILAGGGDGFGGGAVTGGLNAVQASPLDVREPLGGEAQVLPGLPGLPGEEQ